ncbi:MAG: hypothetical protein F9K40_09415 [Kofleriaceae bacterium]|nr:MAG: hypothetical protein F9K40_09415 [Kofleriaceae bacterium]MBZ0238827.1 hypothetical protein [Kofleriaceae bacterium]
MNHRIRSLAIIAALVAVPAVASAATYNIHVGGVCSTRYTNGKGAASSVGSWSGQISINASVDQRDSMSTATSHMKTVLDTYCGSGNSCRIFTYSNGAAVVSRTLAVYSTAWNITSINNSGGNAGGSELSKTSWVAEIFTGCALASKIDPSSHRNGWNHNDTNGKPVYHIAGKGTIWWTFGTTKAFLPGEDDSVVAFHSAAGNSNTSSYSSVCSTPKYSNHFAYNGRCSGESQHHLNISKRFVCLLGGGC